MKKLIIILIISALSILTFANNANYYFSQAGNDATGDGTIAKPYKTVSKFNSLSLQQDDSVFFNRGDVWKEMMSPGGDGILNHHAVITAYGTGAKPVITARDTITGSTRDANWTVYSGNIYYMDVTGLWNTYATANRLWLDGTEQRMAKTFGVINATDCFYHNKTENRFYLYCASGNPGSVYSTLEVAIARYHALDMYGDNYFTFSYIDFQGGWTTISQNASDYTTLDSCNVGLYTSYHGLWVNTTSGSSDYITVKNCLFDSGMRIAYLTDQMYIPYWGIGIDGHSTEWDIYNNYFKDWTYGAICYILYYPEGDYITNIKIHDNYFTAPNTGEGKPIGINVPAGCGTGHEIYNNIMYDLGVGAQLTGEGWKFYNNIIDKVRGATWFTAVSCSGVIMSCNRYSSGGSYYYTNVKDVEFYNNTIVNCVGAGLYLGSNNIGAVNSHNKFYNNILYNNYDGVGYQLYIREFSNIDTLSFKNNLLYHPSYTDVVYYAKDVAGDKVYTVAEFNARNLAATDTIADNIGGNPLFLDEDTQDYHLSTGSPAVNAGIAITGYTTDKDGETWDTPPSIGAYELASYSPPIMPNVITGTITAKDAITITISGSNVLDDGGGTVSARGICYNTTGTPTTSDSKTTNGTGEGAYSDKITGLTEGEIYYFRAYATNEIGTAYGNEIIAKTTKALIYW